MIRRLFVEKKNNFKHEANCLINDLKHNLGIENLEDVRVLVRYDIENLPNEFFEDCKNNIFSELVVDNVYEDSFCLGENEVFFTQEFLPGQFDQRADSACQCVQIVAHTKPVIKCAKVIVLKGNLSLAQIEQIKDYCINKVDSRLAQNDKPQTLESKIDIPQTVKTIDGFISFDNEKLSSFRNDLGLAMSQKDIEFCQSYFARDEKRDPSITEIKMLDTYWSDHCRHTTFLTTINPEDLEFENSPLNAPVKKSFEKYLDLRTSLYAGKQKDICLMDIALLGMKVLKKNGKLDDLEDSKEINAASIVVEVDVDDEPQEWLVMFKNETHNHPTEIEPFGGAATCLGGAIRDPLSGRSYVYQAMRVTGSGDPRTSFKDTLKGKLPQRKITTGAAQGYSSYGNQIGLATAEVSEIYHPGYVAKRLEIGAVIAAGRKDYVQRLDPENGDIILLVGGRTGRDGIGGATGSSKQHTSCALENSAEVQKGDAPTERKLQRLFRIKEVSLMIKRCNDFGAGGISVAIGELSDSLDINLDVVPKKYKGLDATELAISESQERMAVVIDKADKEKFEEYCQKENVECSYVADVTDTGRLRMFWKGNKVVDLSRKFLDTNGTKANAKVFVSSPNEALLDFFEPKQNIEKQDIEKTWKEILSDLNVCSQKGLVERFDSTIGSGTVLHPYGGKYKSTPADVVAGKIPLITGHTNTGTVMGYGFNPNLSSLSPYYGAIYAVWESICKLVSSGVRQEKIRLTFQEYFEKLGQDPKRWGKPFAALLGAFEAQMGFENAAIGGKDSMSGSFNELDVPPTLVSFAVSPVDTRVVISPEYKKIGSHIVLIRPILDENYLPKYEQNKALFAKIADKIRKNVILSSYALRQGGVAQGLALSSFGNKIGVKFEDSFNWQKDLFTPLYGGFLIEVKEDSLDSLKDINFEKIATTIKEENIILDGQSICLDTLYSSWTSPLESVFATKVGVDNTLLFNSSYDNKEIFVPSKKIAKPKIFMPVFPGTNCEYDGARKFIEAGGSPEIFVFKNLSDEAVIESLDYMAYAIKNSNILMLSGGFSSGDEPDGSAKFISAVLRNPKVQDAVMDLIKNKDGLILGICNGFQALIKTGLVPYGEIRNLSSNDPSLTFNNISRHISCYAETRISSNKSPWLSSYKVGQKHTVALSHGEGKFIANDDFIKTLSQNGQIATQYCDENGNASLDISYNPNGSYCGIEGILSPCGRVLGKMGHSERYGVNVAKNIHGDKDQNLFKNAINYYK